MIGIQIKGDAKEIVKKCNEKGLLINSPEKNVIRLLPPLIINKTIIDNSIEILGNVLK